MNCPICCNLMVDAQATNFGPTYKYCQTCKKELAEMGVQGSSMPDTATPFDAEQLLNENCKIVHVANNPGPCYTTMNGRVHRWAETSPGSRCGCHAYERDYQGYPKPSKELDPSDPDYVLPPGAFSMSSGYDAGKVHVGDPYDTVNPWAISQHANAKLTEEKLAATRDGLSKIDPFEKYRNILSGHLHRGRFSSKAPNISNLPKSEGVDYGKMEEKLIGYAFPGADGQGADMVDYEGTPFEDLGKDKEADEIRLAVQKRYLESGGWVHDQGYWAPTKDGQVCFFHMKKIEDALAMEKWRRMGADNHSAMICVDRFSWEDDAMADRRCKPARREILQRTWKARYDRARAVKLAEAYSVGPNKINVFLGRVVVAGFDIDEGIATLKKVFADRQALHKLANDMKTFAQENNVSVVIPSQPKEKAKGKP